MSTIPKSFRRVAETFDRFRQTTVICYYNAADALYMLSISQDHEIGPIILGPVTLKQLEVMQNVLGDIIAKVGITYLD